MRRNASAVRTWLWFAQARRGPMAGTGLASSEPPTPSEDAAQVTSSHALVDACTGHELALVPIEPLVGFLRHPKAHCLHHGSPWPYVLSKEYLLPSWRTEAWPRGGPTRSQTSAFFFDLGASLYDKGAGVHTCDTLSISSAHPLSLSTLYSCRLCALSAQPLVTRLCSVARSGISTTTTTGTDTRSPTIALV